MATDLVIDADGHTMEADDLWVERIPVKETRGYVKRVVESWGIYRLLYDAERPFISLPDTVGGPVEKGG